MNDDFEISFGDIERQLCNILNITVFKIPPLSQSEGYKCANWSGKQIWTGRLRVVINGKNARIILEDQRSKQIFAECPLNHPYAVESVIDSCRYFVLRVVNGNKHAFIGIGMNERNESFDFKLACSEAINQMNRTENNSIEDNHIQSSIIDYSLPQNQKIIINTPGLSKERNTRVVQSERFKL